MVNKEKKRIEKAKQRKAIKGELSAFHQYISMLCKDFKTETSNLSAVREPRVSNDIKITFSVIVYFMCIFIVLGYEKISDKVPFLMKMALVVSSIELCLMIIHLHATNHLYKKNKYSKCLLHMVEGKKEYYSNKITKALLCVSFSPIFFIDFVLRILGLDTIKKYYGTYIIALTLPIIPSLFISLWLTGLLVDRNIVDKGNQSILIVFMMMLLLEIIMVYFIARFSFYIINYNDYLNDRKLKDKEFGHFWMQMKIVIYLMYFMFSFFSKLMDKSIILTSFVTALSLVMMLDTFISRCKDQNK